MALDQPRLGGRGGARECRGRRRVGRRRRGRRRGRRVAMAGGGGRVGVSAGAGAGPRAVVAAAVVCRGCRRLAGLFGGRHAYMMVMILSLGLTI